MYPGQDVQIEFTADQWEAMPYDIRRTVSMYAGPIYPDKNGVFRFSASESVWQDLCKQMRRISERKGTA